MSVPTATIIKSRSGRSRKSKRAMVPGQDKENEGPSKRIAAQPDFETPGLPSSCLVSVFTLLFAPHSEDSVEIRNRLRLAKVSLDAKEVYLVVFLTRYYYLIGIAEFHVVFMLKFPIFVNVLLPEHNKT
ncbi:hypothetical protein ANCCAN_08942 [Ancylostoma caninum]|uniref:Uncharacterized protein n=1 Tax=Ancylostoma caninum TaxID=29170 RepID=A0A368GQ82_ANCCA|nr:hypothetical protein ANCCAN_08942 [Ancylostoma caninum]